jgi:hypothetical protein
MVAFRFTHYDLGRMKAGQMIEVTLSAVANVRLMTPENFELFKLTRPFKFKGGIARKSPLRLAVPEDGHWHVVVDMEGHKGFANSAVKLVAPPAPPPRMSKAS